jgi:hypothetical protein
LSAAEFQPTSLSRIIAPVAPVYMAPIVAIGCYQTVGIHRRWQSTASSAKMERSIARSSKRHLLQICHERAQDLSRQFCVTACDIAADTGLQANGVEDCVSACEGDNLLLPPAASFEIGVDAIVTASIKSPGSSRLS